MPREVTVYTTRSCPHCFRAKDLLKRKGVRFREIDVTEDIKKRKEAEGKYGWMTVPIVVIEDVCIGGADELYALEKRGELDKYLAV